MASSLPAQGATRSRLFSAKCSLPGQGATEYLVLLAVVLIVALVSVSLLGFFPGMANDTRISQSQLYWQAARPFSIQEASITGDSGTLVLQNMDSTDTYTITGIQIGTYTVSITGGPASVVSGQKKAVSFSGGPACSATGAVYDYNVTITYTNQYGITGKKQFGAKNLAVKCTAVAAPTCAGSGESCASLSCCSGLTCDAGICGTCLGDGQEGCDEGKSCCSGLICSANTCTKCAGEGNPCTETPCCSGLVCESEVCITCLGEGETGCDFGKSCCSGLKCGSNTCKPS